MTSETPLTDSVRGQHCVSALLDLRRISRQLERELTASRAECEEQARLNGMGAQREAKLLAELAEAQAVIAQKNRALQAIIDTPGYAVKRIATQALAIDSPSSTLEDALKKAKLEALEEAAKKIDRLQEIIDIQTKRHNEQVSIIYELRRAIFARQENDTGSWPTAELRQQLVERDALVERLQSALGNYIYTVEQVNDPNNFFPECQDAGKPARDALSLTPSTVLAVHDAEVLAKRIHYPQCWDTAAYPTLESALDQFQLRCSLEDCRMAKEG